MPNYKLTYFDARGRAELPRLLFAKAGVEYEDVRLTGDQFKDLKDKLPFGQLPVLEVDGFTVSQSFAISRFLAKRFGFYGKDELEEALIDEIIMGMEDLLNPFVKLIYEPDETRKAEAKKKYEEEQLPGYLKFFERLLIKNKGGDDFFVGDSMTAADLAFAYYITFPGFLNVEIDWTKYPKLKNLKQRVETDDKIAQWMQQRPQTKH